MKLLMVVDVPDFTPDRYNPHESERIVKLGEAIAADITKKVHVRVLRGDPLKFDEAYAAAMEKPTSFYEWQSLTVTAQCVGQELG